MKFLLYVFICICNVVLAQQQMTNFGQLYMHPNSNLSVRGNVQNNGTFNGSGGRVTLSGNNAQTISGSGGLNVFDLTLNNSSAGGITISNNTINISNSLVLTNGKLNTSSTGILHMKDNSTSTGASDNSFVNGPMKKEGNDAFVFPVGKSSVYLPIAISAPSNINEVFTAEYSENDPFAQFGTTWELGIDHISTCEFWILDQESKSSNVDVTIAWNLFSCGITNMTDLRVVHWDTSKWVNMGNGFTSGNNSSGTIRTSSATTRSGIYALASSSSANPLPVELISFEVQKQNEAVKIDWTTASERDNQFFTVEKTKDGFNFEIVQYIDGKGTTNSLNSYMIIDEEPFDGLSYYRLSQTDGDGKVTYFEMKSVYFGSDSELLVFPNPGNGEELNLLSSNLGLNSTVTIEDHSGKVIFHEMISQKDGTNMVQLYFTNKLSSGVYILKLENPGEISQQRFVVK